MSKLALLAALKRQKESSASITADVLQEVKGQNAAAQSKSGLVKPQNDSNTETKTPEVSLKNRSDNHNAGRIGSKERNGQDKLKQRKMEEVTSDGKTSKKGSVDESRKGDHNQRSVQANQSSTKVSASLNEEQKSQNERKNSETKSKSRKDSANSDETASRVAKKEPKPTDLQSKMIEKLAGAQFRYLNEQLYTTRSEEAFEYMQNDPSRFVAYHEGFRTQVEKWPTNPVNVFIKYLRKHPGKVVGDFGCGDAKIAQELSSTHTIHSFDLVSVNPYVTACDVRNVPLEDNSLDVAIFSLALMGTNFLEFLAEAHRTLKVGGALKIAEVRSRFEEETGGIKRFVSAVCELGFRSISVNTDNKMFVLMDFEKLPETNELPSSRKRSANPAENSAPGPNAHKRVKELSGKIFLKPCLYKRR